MEIINVISFKMNFFAKLIISIFMMFMYTYANAQVVKFRKVIGTDRYDYGMSAKQTTDKGYIIGGSTSGAGNGSTDVYIVKTDSLGQQKIKKTFGGLNIDKGICIRQTKDTGYIIVGYTNSFGAGGYDVYLIKTDSSLNELWAKTYGGTDWDFGNCVEQTTDGGFIICGSTYSYGRGNEDYYLIKTNINGDTLWTKTFGGTKEDVANSVIQTSDGGYILTGTTKSMGDSLGDFYTIKTNALGDTIWTNKFGGSHLDYGNDILESQYGGYIVGGETQSFSYVIGSSDGIIVNISASGLTGSNYSTGLRSPLFDNVESITEDNQGRIAMIGMTTSLGYAGAGDVFFNMVDNNLNWINSTTFGSLQYDIGYSVETTADKAFIICGNTEGFNNGLDDIYLIKTDNSGLATVSENIFITTKINEIESSNINPIYPNPATNFVSVNLEIFKNKTTIEIFDMQGEQIFKQTVDSNINTELTINTNHLSNGIYMIRIINESFTASQKLMIQH